MISTNGSDWEDIPGATDATYTTEPVTFDSNGHQYRCKVINTKNTVASDPVYSDPATLSVVVGPSITSHPQSTTVKIGATPTFTVVAEAPDEGGVLSYQWQVSTDGGSNWSNITGATSASYTTPAVTFGNNGNRYRCGVIYTKDGISSNPVYSNPATLSVVAEPSISTHPQDTTVTAGTTATFTIVAQVPDAAEGGALSYQWQVLRDGGAWEDIPGATDASYTTPAVTLADNGNQYRCRVINTKNTVDSDPVYSNTATLYVTVGLSIINHPQNTTVKIGDNATFNVVAEVADEGGVLSYQWQVSTSGGSNWSNIPGATAASYTTPAVTFGNNGDRYRCEVIYTKDGISSNPVYSNPATLRVVAEPSITSHPKNTTTYVGKTATFAIVAVAPDAAEGGVLSYQWQISTDGGSTWNDITGATGSSYTTPVLSLADNGNQYRCRVTNTKNGVASDPVYSGVAALAVVEVEHLIIFIKPTDNDEVNINSGSLVLATIIGDMNEVTSVTIKVDDNEEEPVIPTNNTIYYLLPANLGSGWHTITIKLTNTAGQEIIESVRFYWKSYRRGFGFGRFHFDKEPAEE